jgi:hypothetical protein
MRKLCLAIGLAGVLAAPTLQATITVDRTGCLFGNNGGEFHVTMPSGDAVLAGIGITSPFKTFCLETTEYISMGSSYTVALNTAAVNGGAGGGSPDPLSKGTAWLFSQYWNGGIVINNTALNTAGSATDFQNAIWELENETATGSVAAWINTILFNKFGGNLATWQGNAVNFYGVQVMNLTSGTTKNQDLLVAVPEPTTMIAGALLLLPFGASTLRMLRRKA